jgi:hypothetical protein
MKNIILSASILLTGITVTAQSSLISNLPVTAAITGANTTVLKDKSIVVRYTNSDIYYKAFYDKNGVWLHTVASYEEGSLPEAVRRLVKSSWHGWKISFVDEIQTPGLEPVYQIQVKRDSKLVILRVSDGEMETLQEFTSL